MPGRSPSPFNPANFLFAAGCARSGSSGLVRALHSHDRVVVGMERFKHRAANRWRGPFSPRLFRGARFLDFHTGDTNITPDYRHGMMRAHYETAAQRLQRGDVDYIGDKLMLAPRPVGEVIKRFTAPRIVFVFRDLADVASSHLVQARSGGGSWWDHEDPCGFVLESWHRAFAEVERLIAAFGEERVFVVRFEQFFDGDPAAWRALFGFLGLDLTAEVEEERLICARKWQRRTTGAPELSSTQRSFLEENADFVVRGRFGERADRRLAASNP